MALRIAAVGAVLLSILGRSSASALQQNRQIACLTEEACREQSELLTIIGIKYFAAGNLAADGCFYVGDTAYFGRGGTVESMTGPMFEGAQRIWCSNSSGSDLEAATTDLSSVPSSEPTKEVSKAPTAKPTNAPSGAPSESPSTEWPTYVPTTAPTATPSLQPSKSRSPSADPSAEPSSVPSVSGSPSSEPTASQSPSTRPSAGPSSSAIPSGQPTLAPSISGRPSTSSSPSSQPSTGPSLQPTASLSPSAKPTASPSTTPSQSPSYEPTSTPTGTPSFSPTDVPSKAPVYPPTSAPSPTPTRQPTLRPTSKPTLSESAAASPTEQKVCEDQSQCNLRRMELGYSRFNVGSYPAKGCFVKAGIAYYGVGGTPEQESQTLTGGRERIYCSGSGGANETAPEIESGGGDSNEPEAPELLDVPTDVPNPEYCIDIKAVTDKFGKETGMELKTNPEDGSKPKTVYQVEVGSLESETTYTKRICVEAGRYTFTVKDAVSGMCCQYGRGSYELSVDGDRLVSGGSFKTKSISHDIVVGYQPEMSDEEEKWLEAHNTRRKAFHEKHNKEYRSLKWSPKLAADASKWADQLLLQCKTANERNVQAGENVSAMRYRQESSKETPDMILKRWVDNKQGKSFPDNLTMTQSLWRASRFVGCASKQKKYENGSICYVNVCRYIRPGNCSIKSLGGWLPATLQEKTPCGQACPNDECY